jgi:plasmid stability protein
MAKTIQIRNVPDRVHCTLKARAAQAGMTLSDYLRAEVEELAGLPTIGELTERIRQRSRVKTKVSSATLIRRHRDAS